MFDRPKPFDLVHTGDLGLRLEKRFREDFQETLNEEARALLAESASPQTPLCACAHRRCSHPAMLTAELAMTNTRSEYVTRESVLKLLSTEEVARVSTAETAAHLTNGEEYLDLDALDQGVRRAGGTATPMGHVLPKSAVHADTWSAILKHLAARVHRT